MQFSKMHGIGNDFVVVENLPHNAVSFSPDRIQFLADRKRGVGCDQVLVIEPAENPEAAYRYRIYNADGSEVEQCGNGVRCVARYLWDRGMADQQSMQLESLAGLMRISPAENLQVTVDMGEPNFQPAAIPIHAIPTDDRYAFQHDDRELLFGAASMGNPHVVTLVDDLAGTPVDQIGPEIQHSDALPESANIGFMHVINRSRIDLRVFERGVGETLACGSGACAAVAIGQRWGLLDRQVTVKLPGGQLLIDWAGSGNSLLMTGPAEYAFHGKIEFAS